MKNLIFLLLFFNINAFSQESIEKNAYQFFLDGEYQKAIVLYKKLTKNTIKANHYYPYFNSYFRLQQYAQAEKIAYKMYKKSPKNLTYLVETSICQLKQGKEAKFKNTFSQVKKKITGNKHQTINVTNTFTRYSMYMQSLEIFEKSANVNNANDFGYQKAQLYGLTGNYEKMINEYLDLLERNPSQKQLVITNIQRFLDNDGIESEINYNLVRKRLLLKVQAENNRTEFSEILIWLLMQNHDFKLALVHAKAINRRKKADGWEIYDLAKIFAKNDYFELALNAYDYIIQVGNDFDLNVLAHQGRLDALINQNKSLPSIIDSEYKKAIDQLGSNKNTINLISDYAHYKAFYIHDLESAVSLLESAMKIYNGKEINIARCKIEYADIMLLSGKIWDALLYYSEVEKEFKEHPIGHEAKLKRAKAAYYQGDFEWAKAQLEVLKASTSKLISNDAIELSLLISDNLNLDTTEAVMIAFAQAELLNFQNKSKEALNKYDSILEHYQGHSISDEIYFRKASIYEKRKMYNEAVAMLLKITSDFSYDILSDDATFNLARIYDHILEDKEKAMFFYQQIVSKHQDSIYVAESRKRYRILRGDEANKFKNDNIQYHHYC